MKNILNKILTFFKAIWLVLKSMGSWKGIISLILVWVALSGSGLFALGFILRNIWLKGVGLTVMAFWMGPFTPLIPITIGLAMLIQRYVFFDKNISWEKIKEKFKEAFNENKEK